MRVMFNIGKRSEGDSRYTLLRVESDGWVYTHGGAWKLSASLHAKPFYYRRYLNSYRLTIFWINLHFAKVGRR